MIEQLVLPVIPVIDDTFDNFFTGENQALVSLLQQPIGQMSFVYLWGKQGSGCTHLLNASCHHFSKQDLLSINLSMAQNRTDLNVAMLQGLEQLSLICIDDLQNIATDLLWQEALFNLFNRVQDHGKTRLIFAGNQPPKSLGLTLVDLETRLSWGGVYQVHLLQNDHDKLKALQCQSRSRGFTLSDEVGAFLLTRVSRNMTDLVQLLQRIDKQSLVQQRKITIPFIKGIL